VGTTAGTKGLPANSPLTGEEWISGPWAITAYASALRRLPDPACRRPRSQPQVEMPALARGRVLVGALEPQDRDLGCSGSSLVWSAAVVDQRAG